MSQNETLMDGRLAVTVQELILVLPIARTTAYKLIAGGTLQTIKVGTKRLILTSSVRELMRGRDV